MERRRKKKCRALMVCLGNICRSPIAEAVFANIIKEKGLQDKWEVDSAAMIGYHTGKNPDPRAMKVLEEKGITDYVHKARPIEMKDFSDFDFIFGMDERHLQLLEEMAPLTPKADILLLGLFDSALDIEIRDPYYDTDNAGFLKVYEQCDRSIRRFLDRHQRNLISD